MTVIRELSDAEFHATSAMPMHRLEEGESFRPVPLGDYVSECIRHHELPTSREAIEVECVYLSGDQRYTHVLIAYGIRNVYLVIVIAHETDSVLGHHLLDLNEKYGLTSPSNDA